MSARSPSPTDRWLRQAERVRRQWRTLSRMRRDRLITRLQRENHPIGRVWIDVLERAHPLVAWLDGDGPASDLLALQTTPEARQLITSHPFSDWTPWSTPATSPASSSTPRE